MVIHLPKSYWLMVVVLAVCSTSLCGQEWFWTQTSAPTRNWYRVASSSDGKKLVAVVYSGGIYTSTDSGATWTQTSAPSKTWASVASSSNGTKLVAVADWDWIYTSSDSVPLDEEATDAQVLLG